MIIDIHTHAWPDKVSRKAKENLEELFKVKLIGEPTVETLLKFMDKNAISVSAICAVATRPEQVPSINDWLFSIRGERIKAFASLHPEYPLWSEELERIKQCADGIKLQPEFQNFYIDDEKVFPIYEKIEQLGLPLLFHCGQELSGTMLVRSSPKRLLKVKERFPALRIIAAHFGGFKLWQEVEEHLLGKDIYLDTSFFFDYLPKEELRRLILKHRPDRLLFGTDFPLVDQKKDIDFLKNLGLPPTLVERIFSLNGMELLGL
ncbi:MAG: amidohydrolase family protein [Candidatus Omnitrophota bacterium]